MKTIRNLIFRNETAVSDFKVFTAKGYVRGYVKGFKNKTGTHEST